MDPLGGAVFAVAKAVVRGACRMWFPDGTIGGDVSQELGDMLMARVAGSVEQRRLARTFENFAEVIAANIQTAYEAEFEGLAQHERLAAIEAVKETFNRARLDDKALLESDLDARYLERYLRAEARPLAGAWGLSADGTALYDLVLRESCSFLLSFLATLPTYSSMVLTEVLRRSGQLEDQLQQLLERTPARRSMDGDEGFEADYCRQVVRRLDRLELFGTSLTSANGNYPVSVAYISLTVMAGYAKNRRAGRRGSDQEFEATADPITTKVLQGDRLGLQQRGPHAVGSGALSGVPVETVLADSNRLFVRGEAGSGKTTLLQWLAVGSARGTLTAELAEWNERVPFFIPLRRYANSDELPAPEHFVDHVGRTMAAEMPQGWVNKLLRSGRAIVLIDGVDELPKNRRKAVHEWLGQLLDSYPDAHYVITSRPAAVAVDWLERERFTTGNVQPMNMGDVRQFIRHWHAAISSTVIDTLARQELERYQDELIDTVFTRRDLRLLATNPLMCALLCALNRDRRARLPHDRLELYRIALDMFLHRRDVERAVDLQGAALNVADIRALLQEIANWFMRNDKTEEFKWRLIEQLEGLLRTRHTIRASAGDVLDYLLERSGLLREPVVGVIDFVHRTFQEFLAALCVVERDDIEDLVRRAPDDAWRPVVILAVGLANPTRRRMIVSGLLDPPRKMRDKQSMLDLVAVACLETARDLDPELHDEIGRRAERLIPPRTPDDVAALSVAGELALELLEHAAITRTLEATHACKLAARIGGPGGLHFIERMTGRNLLRSADFLEHWDGFEANEYADRVLARAAVEHVALTDISLIRALDRIPSLRTISCRFTEPWGDFVFLERISQLRSATLFLPEGARGLRIALPAHRAISVEIRPAASWSSRISSSPNQIPQHRYRTSLPVSGVNELCVRDMNSTQLLADAAVHGGEIRMAILNDRALRSLERLMLPEGLVELELHGCAKLATLEGIERLIGSGLRALSIGWTKDLPNLAPLFHANAAAQSIVDQLEVFQISASNGYVAQPIIDLAPKGFRLEVHSEPTSTSLVAITWTHDGRKAARGTGGR